MSAAKSREPASERRDNAVGVGTMTPEEHGLLAARAGGAASAAIDHLMTLRMGDQDLATLLRSIAEELPAGCEAAK